MIVMSHPDPILAALNPTALICCIHLLQVHTPNLNTDQCLMSNVVHRYVGTHCMSIKGCHKTKRNNKAVIPSSHFDSCTPSWLLSPSTHPHLNINSTPPGTNPGRRGRLTSIACVRLCRRACRRAGGGVGVPHLG